MIWLPYGLREGGVGHCRVVLDMVEGRVEVDNLHLHV